MSDCKYFILPSPSKTPEREASLRGVRVSSWRKGSREVDVSHFPPGYRVSRQKRSASKYSLHYVLVGSMICPKRFLFVWWEGGGNMPPALHLIRQLVAKGH